MQVLLYLYLIGAAVLAVNLLRQMAVLLWQSYKGPAIRDGRYRIVTMSGLRGPCSFGNIIFIHPDAYDPDTYHQILLHEKIHAGGWHTVDILLAELGIVFQWFNPFIWLFRREMENNLEFLTDRNVLQHPGIERAAYQLSLVKVAAPDMSVSITSNYNQSLLKRRIIMMNVKNSARHTAWKYFFLLPLFILLAALLNRPAVLAQAVRGHSSSSGKAKKAVPSDTVKVPDVVVSVQVTPDVVTNVVTDVQPVVSPTVVVDPVGAVAVDVDMPAPVPAPVPDVVVTPDTPHPSSRVDRSEGSWFIVSSQDNKSDKIDIELRGDNDDHHWNSNFSVLKSQLTSFNSVGKVDFSLTREAGTLHFTGQFDGEQGFGHYKFQPDAGYQAYMRQKKMIDDDNGDLISFFMVDIKKGYVDMLQANGFPEISRGHLISMAALGIDEAYIKSIRESGYSDISEGHLITFKSLHIDKPFIDDIRSAGYDHPDASKLITFKSLKIDGAYLRKFPSTSAEDVITYKSLKIDSDYVASLKRVGYTDLSSRDLVTLRSMKVDADYIKGFNAIGYTDIPVHKLVSFKSMGITPEYIKSFQETGLKDISQENFITMKSVGVTPAFIKGFMDLGYKDITPHNMTSLKAMNITPDFVKAFNAIGFKDIPLNQLNSLKAMGVTPDYVTKMKEKGFVSDDLNKYIRLKNAFN
jgi:hypothetical protein